MKRGFFCFSFLQYYAIEIEVAGRQGKTQKKYILSIDEGHKLESEMENIQRNSM